MSLFDFSGSKAAFILISSWKHRRVYLEKDNMSSIQISSWACEHQLAYKLLQYKNAKHIFYVILENVSIVSLPESTDTVKKKKKIVIEFYLNI